MHQSTHSQAQSRKRKRRGIEELTQDLGETLVWNTKLENFLYHRHRIWAQRVGAARTISHHQRKLPALMSREQTGLIFGYRSGPMSLEGERSLRDIVHADLVHRGYIISSACRYGGDYVIYEAHPSVCHSSHTVRVLGYNEQIAAIDLAGYCRVQSSVLKRAVFSTTISTLSSATGTGSPTPVYININYNPSLSNDPSKKVERRLSRAIVESPISPRAIEAKRCYDAYRQSSSTPKQADHLIQTEDDDEFAFAAPSPHVDGASDEEALGADDYDDDDEDDVDDDMLLSPRSNPSPHITKVQNGDDDGVDA